MRKPTVARPQTCLAPPPHRCKAKRRGSLPFVCPRYAYRELTRGQAEMVHITGSGGDTSARACVGLTFENCWKDTPSNRIRAKYRALQDAPPLAPWPL